MKFHGITGVNTHIYLIYSLSNQIRFGSGLSLPVKTPWGLVMLCLLFCVGIVFQNPVTAQDIKFRHLGINDGLSQNAVFSTIQDSKGFMWFGTKDGLNRYDGYNFVIYQHNPFDSTSVSDNFIYRLFEDSRGRIWISSLSGDVNVFHRGSEFFCKIPLKKEIGEKLTTNEITAIAEAPDGTMWIATKGDGLIQILVDGDNGCNYSYRQFLHDPADDRSLSSNLVANLFFDENEVLWVGTEYGLNQYHKTSESFTRTLFKTKHPEAPIIPGGDYKICAMHLSRTGDFWIGTQSGLVKFDRVSGNYEYYPNQYEVFRYSWGSVNIIVEDDNGRLWLGTAAGLMHFEPSTKHYTYFQNDPLKPQSLSYNIISSLLIDKTGVLWVGTSGHGINTLDLKASRFKTLERPPDESSRITGFSVRSILEDNSNVLWISADVLYRWNRNTGELISLESNSDRPDDFGNTDAYSMIQTSDGLLWFASTQGLYRYNPANNQTRLYARMPGNDTGLLFKEVNVVFEDRNNSIWIATHNYFSKLINEQTGAFQHFRYHPSDHSQGLSRPVIFQDSDGMFWLGTADGLVRFNPADQSFYTYRNDPANKASLSNNLIKSILEDPVQPETYLWIGTSGGLNKFDYRAETFEHYTVRDGLPNDVVYGLLPDDEGNLWLSTNTGLSRFNPKNETFRNFDVKDGLQSNEFNTGAYYRSKSGELFFGGISGLNYFNPDQVVDNPHIPTVVLTRLRVHDQYITPQNRSDLLKTTITEASEVVLRYDDDVISFEFAALDYSAPGKNQYAYKLENFNQEWIYSGSQRTATYTNLPPGDYIFRVKASNNDGIWNDTGVALSLIITPPWWRTWWAYVIYSLLFLTTLFRVRQYELKRVKLKNQLKVEMVETGTLRKLDQLKSQFFANISHEFRTPLTLILGQVESVMGSDIETSQKVKLQVANRNANRLLTLINQLLDLSRLEAGNLELNASQHNIVSFLKSLFYSFESMAVTQQIQLSFESDVNKLMVSFDTDMMEKIFYNLVSNALKFTSEGGSVKVIVRLLHPNMVEIALKDTGHGISAEQLPHIFDRFYQADSTSTRAYEGSGIGLALAKELTELHGGTLTVSSIPGQGSEFTITLPIGDTEQTAGADAELNEDFLPAQELAFKNDLHVIGTADGLLNLPPDDNKNIILIVEDNEDVRAYIREQLEDENSIMEAANGEIAINIARDTIPDLIISDVMMPKMDGFEFCKAIRGDERTSHIPIIMLTAKAGLDSKIEGLETGVDAYLTKPFSARELKVRVKNLINQREQLRKRFSSATSISPAEVSTSGIDKLFLEKLISVINEYIEIQDLATESIASELNMSTTQLNRKLKALIDQPIGQFIRSVRLQRAAELLGEGSINIAQVCFMVGFNDHAYFSRAFKKQFGCSPTEYKSEKN